MRELELKKTLFYKDDSHGLLKTCVTTRERERAREREAGGGGGGGVKREREGWRGERGWGAGVK